MPISPAAPNFPLDVSTGAGIRAVREGATWRFDLNDEPILTTGEGAYFRVATEAGRTKLRNGLTVTIQADRDFLGVPYVELDDNAPVRWVDVDGTPLARIVVGRVYRISYDLAQDVMRSDVLSLVNNANLGPMAGATLKGNAGATPGGPQDIPLSLLAAPGNPIGDQIKDRVRFEEAPPLINERISRSLLYRRKLRCEVPFTPGVVQDALAAAGHQSTGYPNAFAINHATGDLWVTYGFTASDGSPKAFICDYDISNPAAVFPPLKTWFYTGQSSREGLVYREIGASRYLYALGANRPMRLNITATPAPGSSLTAELFPDAVVSYSQICRVGDGWAYANQDSQNPGRYLRKQKFITADIDFNPTGYIEFPISAIGSYTSTILHYLPKQQAITYHRGQFVFGVGGDYRPAGGRIFDLYGRIVPEHYVPSKAQGIIVCGSNGDVTQIGLCDPRTALQLTGQMIGRTITVHENEGVYSDVSNGELYALWQTLTPDQEGSNVGRVRGVVITRELCPEDDAFDYKRGLVDTPCSLDQRSRVFVAQYGVQITHPITGLPLTTVDQILDMMSECALLEYRFNGYNNGAILDLNGVALPLAGGPFVTAKIAVASACDFTIDYGDGGQRRIRFGNINGTRTQTSPPSYSAGGVVYGGDANSAQNVPAAGKYGYSLDAAGILRLAFSGTPLYLGRGPSNGYTLPVYRDGTLIGGLYQSGSTLQYVLAAGVLIGLNAGSPEGVVSAGVGSLIISTTDGRLYRKASGTGNTGWVAL
ncbi:hypothetical protein ASF36_22050 [Methylobacterium sp. Leaf90]|nr:hypothetical protein ASF36_22050 [Methylobacterium sp. Leaf90]